jgi:hypothetical protein
LSGAEQGLKMLFIPAVMKKKSRRLDARLKRTHAAEHYAKLIDLQ